MPQLNYTPVQLYRSGTAGNTPSAGLLQNGELAINYADGKLFYKDDAGVVQTIVTPDGSVTPAKLSTGGPSWDASGNLGIGTTSPSFRLDVAGGGARMLRQTSGGVSTTGASGNFFAVGRWTIAQGAQGQRLQLRVIGGVGYGQNQTGETIINCVIDNTNTISGYFYGTTYGSGTATDVVFKYNSDGYDFWIKSEQFASVAVIPDATDGHWVPAYGDTGSASQPSGSTALGTLFAVTTGGNERARIDSNGNFIIGKTSYAFTGVSGVTIGPNTSGFEGGSGSPVIQINRTGSFSDIAIEFYRNYPTDGSVKGAITVTTSGTAYNTSSDYRLKHDIAPMQGALERVKKLKPVTYKWNADGSDGEGFIAHELAEVCPHAVTGEKDAVDADGKPVYQGIDTSFLVATLTAAIQEQQVMIAELRGRVEALEAK